MYLNDFKPYLYMTNDYGQHWTLLTDGTNGIPADEPMHVVREDPEQEGLLYAGTLQGAYVSFDQGKHWQTLQQNLPATPVTDIKVHHGDLVISTMGRSFWIMDDVAPLRQIAASVTKPRAPHHGSTDPPLRSAGIGRRLRLAPATMSFAHRCRRRRPRTTAATAGGVASPRRRRRSSRSTSRRVLVHAVAGLSDALQRVARRPDVPEYPAAGARIDYFLASPSGEVKLEILDAARRRCPHLHERRAVRPAGGRGGRRGGGLPSALPTKIGMNRFVWDLRYPGGRPAAAATGRRRIRRRGPLVAPGAIRARLTAGGVTKTESFTVKIDPRIAKDGITVADLAEQTKFALKVRDAAGRSAAGRAAGASGDGRQAWRSGEAAGRVWSA